MNTAPLSCAELVEIVTDYLDNAMSPELRRRFDDHLAQCDGCTEYVEQIRETIRAVGSVSEESLSEPGREALLEAFRDWSPLPEKRRRWRRSRRGPSRD